MKKEVQDILIAIMTKLMEANWVLHEVRTNERFSGFMYTKEDEILSFAPANDGIGPLGKEDENSILIYFVGGKQVINQGMNFQFLLNILDYILKHKALPIKVEDKANVYE